MAGGPIGPTPNGSALDRSKLGSVTYSDNFKQSQWFQWDIPPGSDRAYIANTPWNGNFGDAAYSQPGDGTTGVTFNEPLYGGLKLSLYQDAGHANAWYGGLISTVDRNGRGFAAADGYWEINAKLPANPSGPWFAFWLDAYFPTAQYGTLLLSTELDIIEWYGKFPNTPHMVYHLWNSGSEIYPTYNDAYLSIDTLGLGLAVDALTSGFNRYGLLVTDNWVRHYLNDVQLWSWQRSEYSRAPMGCMIDLAGGGAGGQNPLVNGTGPFDAYVTQFLHWDLA